MLSVSLAGTMLEGLTSSGIMQMVSQANREIENWNIEIFGDMEKDAEGNLVQKQWTIPRSDSKTIHATENNEVKSAYEKLMNNEQNQKDKARYEELSKREYESLTESEKEELNNLSRNLVTVRDGKLGEHIGYAPMFRSGKEGDELDLEKGRDYNLADKGLGQMGAIMLDFQWNSMRASQGWAKLSLPMYDQPLWKNNGSWFEPPTLRSVSSVVMEIVGTATGQSWWLGYADDLLFAAMDVGGGYKSASEVGLELAKTAATAVIGKGIGAGSNALGDLAGKAMQGAGKVANFAVQAGISMTTNYVTTVANSAVNSVYIGEDGKLGFKTEDFTKSLYSANTISGALGAGITGGMGALNLRDGNNIKLNSNTFNVSGISAFNSLAGGLVQNGVALAMGGNANFNLLSFKGVGMLEFSFGKDGVKSKIGMGGTNISIQNLRNVAAGYKEASKVTDWKYGSTETSSTLNSINMLGYTTSGMNHQLAKDIWNEKLAVEYGDTGNDYGNYTLGERKIVLSENLLGGGREASAKLATVMSHEGTHYNGNRVEALAHLAGAETYSQLNEMFKLQADKSFSMEMLSGIMNADNWKENTGDVDHWKIEVIKGHIYARWDESQNITLPNGTIIKLSNDTGKISASKLSKSLFGNTLNAEIIENLFQNSSEQLSWDEEKQNWFNKDGETLTKEDNFSIDITSIIDSSKKYSKDFDNWLTKGSDGQSGMEGVDLYDIGGLSDGLFGYINRTRLLADVAAMTSTLTGTAIERVNQFKSMEAHFKWVGGEFSYQYEALFNSFVNHIGKSIAPYAQSMSFSDDTFKYNGVDYSSILDGKSVHTGGDSNNSIVGTPIQSAFGGRVDTSSNPLYFSTLFSIYGSSVTVESGFNFGDRFISTGVWLQYRHMNNMSNVLGSVFDANTKLGELSDVWDKGSIASHLHLDIVTETNSTTSQWFQNLFPTNSESNITWKIWNETGTQWSDSNYSLNRTYWNPKNIWDEYWKVVK